MKRLASTFKIGHRLNRWKVSMKMKGVRTQFDAFGDTALSKTLFLPRYSTPKS